MNAFTAMLKQLRQLSKKKNGGTVAERLSERQREELLELKRVAEKEMQALADPEDIYLREYIQNIDDLLRAS